ncbi:unnamed protein product [Toxocara canis]|uniref:Secreted protein n=1 Tax=Toxocara canis TaxID=6265 RepID=A0A183UYI7_TOXCA|nr:unnamed protein product [Toxocara canis]
MPVVELAWCRCCADVVPTLCRCDANVASVQQVWRCADLVLLWYGMVLDFRKSGDDATPVQCNRALLLHETTDMLPVSCSSVCCAVERCWCCAAVIPKRCRPSPTLTPVVVCGAGLMPLQCPACWCDACAMRGDHMLLCTGGRVDGVVRDVAELM